MNAVINLDILNYELKPSVIVLFLELVRLSQNGEVVITVGELMKLTNRKNKKQVIDYLKELKEKGLINYSSETNRANTYILNGQYFSK